MGIGEVTLHASPVIGNNSFSEVGEAEKERNANDDESVENNVEAKPLLYPSLPTTTKTKNRKTNNGRKEYQVWPKMIELIAQKPSQSVGKAWPGCSQHFISLTIAGLYA